MTIACGDSHTSTHGAFGSIAFGIGTSQVADVLASQTMALGRPKVRRVVVNGTLAKGVYAKDVALHIIRKLGVNGGVGYAYEYAGNVFSAMSMEERMTVCNMSIEGGARCGYINPDQKTVDYLRGRPFAPQGEAFEKAAKWWLSLASGPDATFDDDVSIPAAEIEPTVTWGINPGQSVGVNEPIPAVAAFPKEEQAGVREALEFMEFHENQSLRGTKIDVAFIGRAQTGASRTCGKRPVSRRGKSGCACAGAGRSRFPVGADSGGERGATRDLPRSGLRVAGGWMQHVPGDEPDKLKGRELCASSSNRNFKGRQGSPTGRTLLMSPAMVAARR